MNFLLSRRMGPLGAAFFVCSFLCFSALAGTESGQLKVKAVQGTVTFATSDGVWHPLQADTVLERGTTIKTEGESTADLLLQYNGSVLRLTPNTILAIDALDKNVAGEDVITETSLSLKAGGIVGSQRKLAKPSRFEISIPGGTATIRGTEYLVRSDGAITTLSGSVSVRYNLPGNKGSVSVIVPAGSSFNPATGEVVPTTPDYLTNIIKDIDTVRHNAEVFKAGGATIVVKPDEKVSPIHPGPPPGVPPGPPAGVPPGPPSSTPPVNPPGHQH